jgi:hypothetical protein
MFGNTILAQHLGFVCRALIPQHQIPDSSARKQESIYISMLRIKTLRFARVGMAGFAIIGHFSASC